jgi:hypothetical protein
VEHTFTIAAFNVAGTGPPATLHATPGTETAFVNVTVSPSAPTAGQTVTVAATLLGIAQDAAVPGVTARLNACPLNAPSCTTYYARTSATGRVTFSFVIRQHTETYLDFTKQGRFLGTSWGGFVNAKSKVTGVLSSSSVPLGGTVTMKGTVSPVRYHGFVYVQRYYGGAWHTGTYRTQSTTGAVAIPLTLPRGTYTYRLYSPGTWYVDAGYSPSRTFTVV